MYSHWTVRDPPAKFRPLDSPRCRQRLWRTGDRFPDVRAGFEWLCEIFIRVHDSVPPVTEAEFAELAAWFRTHLDRLGTMCQPWELLELGDGEATSFGNVRWGIEKGARVGRGERPPSGSARSARTIPAGSRG